MNNKIKQMRKERKITQEDLARVVGVSRQSIISIEKGKYEPSLSLAFKLAAAFQCSIEELFIYEEGIDE